MEGIDLQHIHSVFNVFPQDDGSVKHQLSAKYALHNGSIDVLEDHFGLMHGVKDGTVNETVAKFLRSIGNSMYMKDVNHQDWLDGHHPELYQTLANTAEVTPEAQPEDRVNQGGTAGMPVGPGRTSRFTYQVKGSPEVHQLYVRGNAVVLDGQALEDEQIQVLRNAVDNGEAEVRYAPEESELQRMESVMEDLLKLEPTLQDALGSMRAAVKAGHIKPEHLKALTGSLFKDTMVPSLGNKKAYQDFLASPRNGVHVMADANGFKGINDTFGHEAGDKAIKALGGAFREALDESSGRANAKGHRVGGDEFHAHLPTHEHAARFARVLRQKLDQIPAIGGTHKLSMSLGFGASPEHADKALYAAKAAKDAMNYPKGQAQMHVHSLVPGHEGAVPAGDHPMTLKPPTVAKPEAPAPVTPAAPVAEAKA
jgi:diguanylate cyclase (GGDEF)-like protein